MAAMIGHNRGNERMYAIVFDLDTTVLQDAYHNPSWNNAYSDIRRVLEQRGFEWQQGSTYFGSERVTPVDCVLAVQELRRTYDWFKPCVRDIRMLRIEENNDLGAAMD
jgi:virulence-associated protein VapD